MSSFQRKFNKLKRDPRQFLVDTKQYKLLKSKFNIDLVKIEPVDRALVFINNTKLMSAKSVDKRDNSVQKKKNEYDNFNLSAFKKNHINVGDKLSYNKIVKLWEKYPWTIKLIKAQVFLMENNQDFLGIVRFLEEAISGHNNSKDIKLLYVQYLRKAGIYDISKTTDILLDILQKHPDYIDARYYLCQFLWEAEGITPLLMENVKFLYKRREMLSKVQINFLCACQYEAGRYTDAYRGYLDIRDELTRRYFTLEMLYEINRDQMKVSGESTRVQYYNMISKFQTEFVNLVRNADKLAIVGNGPSELGLNRGKEIDSSDLIIRFNDFMTGGQYALDYGYKTDIWVKGGYFIDIGRKEVSQFKGIIQSGNNPLYRNSSFDDFYLDSKLSHINYSFIPPKVYYELISKIQTSPSAGLVILYWIYLIKGYVKKEWVYGFTFGNQPNNTSEHYFKNKSNTGFYPHNWDKEAVILNSIIE